MVSGVLPLLINLVYHSPGNPVLIDFHGIRFSLSTTFGGTLFLHSSDTRFFLMNLPDTHFSAAHSEVPPHKIRLKPAEAGCPARAGGKLAGLPSPPSKKRDILLHIRRST